MFSLPLLSTLIWLPMLGALGIFLLGGDKKPDVARWLTLIVSTVCLLLCIPLWKNFQLGTASYQFVENLVWFESLDIRYALGVDGFGMPLVALTCLFTPIVALSSWKSVNKKTAQYLAAFLVMQGLMCGVFSAMDSILFYIFFEATLIPMFLIIGIWGGPDRVYATIKFFIYTFLGSVFLLIALIYCHQAAVAQNLDNPFMIQTFFDLKLPLITQQWLFFGFLLAFAVKIPMWPVHTWLPDAHVEAPTGGSVILAAIMLKMGAYGFLRFMLPIVPDACRELSWLILAMSLIAIAYIGFVAIAQKDMKKLIAYSSVAHMGFVTLGIFLTFGLMTDGATSEALMGLEGAYVQVISHGFISGALFLCVGVLYDRMHSRKIADYGGVVNSMPIFAAFFVFFALANCGLPGTSGFVGEFLVILASFKANFWFAVIAASTLILGAAYSLWMIKRVVFGDVANKNVAALQEITATEKFYLGVLALLTLIIGLWPAPLLEVTHASAAELMNQLSFTKF